MFLRTFPAAAVLVLGALVLLFTPETATAQRWPGGGGRAYPWTYGPAPAYRGSYPAYYRSYYPYYGSSPRYSRYLGYYYPGYYPYGVYVYPSYYLYSGPNVYVPDYSAYAPAPSVYQSFYPPYPGSAESVQTASPVLIEVHVPSAEAEVWFDGVKTTQTGTLRSFLSPSLAPGGTFTYTVRARWTEDGRPVEQTRRISVQAGHQQTVDFRTPARSG
jgi:uncharacterized protein (TIGR03000 family)